MAVGEGVVEEVEDGDRLDNSSFNFRSLRKKARRHLLQRAFLAFDSDLARFCGNVLHHAGNGQGKQDKTV